MVSFATHFVGSPSGAIECLRANDGADPARGAFILLHGIQGTAATWSEVAAHLGAERVILMPNLRGRGRSLCPENGSDYTLDGFATDLRAVIEATPGPLTLVAWSMGVLVTLACLARGSSERLDGLVLASGTPRPGGEAVWFQSETVEDLADEARERAERLGLSAYATPTAVAGSWASVRAADLRAELGRLRLPTLVLHGDRDDQCPLSHGREIAAAIPGAALEIWRDGGHNLMAQDPVRFARSVLRLYAATQTDIVYSTQ